MRGAAKAPGLNGNIEETGNMKLSVLDLCLPIFKNKIACYFPLPNSVFGIMSEYSFQIFFSFYLV